MARISFLPRHTRLGVGCAPGGTAIIADARAPVNVSTVCGRFICAKMEARFRKMLEAIRFRRQEARLEPPA